MRRLFRLLAWLALVVGVVVGALRATAIRWWRVPENDPYLTASLSPSLEAGDLVLLWRATRPGLGDLVMCPEPRRPDRVVLGRIAAEQHQQITVKGSAITLNGRAQHIESACTPRTFVEAAPGTGVEVEQVCDVEELGGSTHLRGGALQLPPPVETSREVPAGSVWLVSDNRQFPYDSRDFGEVARDTCQETVFFRLVGRSGFGDSARRLTYVR